MTVKILAAFRKPAIFAVAMISAVVITNQTAGGDTPHHVQPGWKQQSLHRVIVAQNETQTPAGNKGAAPAESKESEPKTDQKKESGGVKKKPLKDFKPSERIEAEQAVDFPYDI